MFERMTKEQWRETEKAIINFPETKEKYEEALSKKTAFQKTEECKKMRKEILSIEAAFQNLRADQQKVIEQRFWSGEKKPYYDIDCYYSEGGMKKIIGRFVRNVFEQMNK